VFVARRENHEIAQLADALRKLSPLDVEALERGSNLLPASGWRRGKAYADLEANGVVRGRTPGRVDPARP
jgi:hypothetical protein